MKAFVLLLCVMTVFAGEIVCNLCVDAVGLVERLLTIDGAERAKEYIDNLCAKTSGFLNTLCEKILDFGVDEIIKLIETHVEPHEVCVKLHAC